MINYLIKKQRGYALIVVLLIITIIAIITPPLISKIMNGALQYKKAEQNIQLEKLREMGITYIKSVVNESVNEINTEADALDNPTAYKNKVESYILQVLPEFQITKKFNKSENQFRLIINSINLDTSNRIVITYQITPSIKNNVDEKYTSQEEIVIRLK
ncbi:hypothetical protein ACFFF5_00245 [Lederbergia wuyishanensis]|uniref:Type II secretory pathway component PulK n=1 Tax=Lederbergia wuyishanensis TaxID=1347903 RepID=A0ABU0D1U9_9BACI|nr:hypothetical protein [Lederbergia wuyishanensis]MCJ8006995.1 hypothetical protein [Lederbergia wuyishanensis]MDQ0342379.1 type II secretory pathway component PulK [Lederbergia wuyishanensis]